MCNQAVSLAAAEIERNGVATVAIILLRDIALRVRPPRALAVPFPHGFPLGRPNDPERQQCVLDAASALLEDRATQGPLLRDFVPPA